MNWQEVAFRESPRSVLEAAEMEEEQGEEEAEGENLSGGILEMEPFHLLRSIRTWAKLS